MSMNSMVSIVEFLNKVNGRYPVTSWKRLKDGEYKHNHIENGHVENDKPTGQPHQTKSWKEGDWKREWMWLNEDGKVVEL